MVKRESGVRGQESGVRDEESKRFHLCYSPDIVEVLSFAYWLAKGPIVHFSG
jgi:hypothetical protein